MLVHGTYNMVFLDLYSVRSAFLHFWHYVEVLRHNELIENISCRQVLALCSSITSLSICNFGIMYQHYVIMTLYLSDRKCHVGNHNTTLLAAYELSLRVGGFCLSRTIMMERTSIFSWYLRDCHNSSNNRFY